MTVFETKLLLRELSKLVELALANRDDESQIRAQLADGTASLRFGFDSAENVISIGLKTAGRIEPLDAVFADGHEHSPDGGSSMCVSSRPATAHPIRFETSRLAYVQRDSGIGDANSVVV